MKFIPMMGLSGPTFTQPTLRPFQSASPSREVIVAFLGQREFVFTALIFRKCQRAFFADTSAFETLSHHFASIKLLQVVRQLARNCRKQAITQLDRCSMSVTAILHQLERWRSRCRPYIRYFSETRIWELGLQTPGALRAFWKNLASTAN